MPAAATLRPRGPAIGGARDSRGPDTAAADVSPPRGRSCDTARLLMGQRFFALGWAAS